MRILAALDDSEQAPPVCEFAAALGPVLRADVDAVHVRTKSRYEAAAAAATRAGLPLRILEGDPCECLLDEARADDLVAIVIGHSRKPRTAAMGRIARELVVAQPKPVVLVPVDATHPGRLSRALFPLEGTRATSLAPRSVIRLARGSGLEIVVLHVFDLEAIPPFSDQPQHESREWAREFLARYSPCPPDDVRLETRVGRPEELVPAVVREIDADVVAFAWAQELAPGRARVVRATLEEARTPLLLIPATVGVSSASPR